MRQGGIGFIKNRSGEWLSLFRLAGKNGLFDVKVMRLGHAGIFNGGDGAAKKSNQKSNPGKRGLQAETGVLIRESLQATFCNIKIFLLKKPQTCKNVDVKEL
uniref:Uncharacterized protein n=1 Tax=Salix viminalis TaxID=40686 RepID=A0A6N2KIB5_SALVM